MWLLACVAILISLQIYDYYLLRKSTGLFRFVAWLVLALAILPWPYLIPEHMPVLRFIVAMIVFIRISKSAEIAYNRMHDPEMASSFGRYLYWSTCPPDTAWPKNEQHATLGKG